VRSQRMRDSVREHVECDAGLPARRTESGWRHTRIHGHVGDVDHGALRANRTPVSNFLLAPT
jgi:hypothetical protein